MQLNIRQVRPRISRELFGSNRWHVMKQMDLVILRQSFGQERHQVLGATNTSSLRVVIDANSQAQSPTAIGMRVSSRSEEPEATSFSEFSIVSTICSIRYFCSIVRLPL